MNFYASGAAGQEGFFPVAENLLLVPNRTGW